MTTKYQSPIGHGEQFTDDNGDPLASGTINTYVAGTTTNKATYKDNAGAATHANPIVLGANGRVPGDALWLDNDQDYKFVLKDSGGTTIYTIDNIAAIVPAGATVTEWVSGPAPTYIGATSFSVSGDYTSILHLWRRLKLTDITTHYASITAADYSAGTGLTTITVVVDGGTALTANLTAIAYSLNSADNPSVPAGEKALTVVTAAVSQAGTTGVLQSYTLPANTLSANGQVLRVRHYGTRSGAGGNMTIQSRFGTTPTARGNALTISSGNDSWLFDVYLVRVSSTAVNMVSIYHVYPTGINYIFVAATTDIDLTADQIIDTNVSVINGADTGTQEGMIIELLN